MISRHEILKAQGLEFDLIPLRPPQARKARGPRLRALALGQVAEKPTPIAGHRGATPSAKASR